MELAGTQQQLAARTTELKAARDRLNAPEQPPERGPLRPPPTTPQAVAGAGSSRCARARPPRSKVRVSSSPPLADRLALKHALSCLLCRSDPTRLFAIFPLLCHSSAYMILHTCPSHVYMHGPSHQAPVCEAHIRMSAWVPCHAPLANGMSKVSKAAMIEQSSGVACRLRGRSRRTASGQPRPVCGGRAAAATAGVVPHRRHRKGPSSALRTSAFRPGLQLLHPTVGVVRHAFRAVLLDCGGVLPGHVSHAVYTPRAASGGIAAEGGRNSQ